MHLSFSCERASCLQALLIVIFVPLGLMAPILYFAWWGLAGGQERGIRARIEKTLELDAKEEARKAIARNDLKLYCTGGVLDREVPGRGPVCEDYETSFGYRLLPLFFGEGLTDGEEDLNFEAREYMKAYNQLVIEHVEKACPRWQAEVNSEEMRYVSRE